MAEESNRAQRLVRNWIDIRPYLVHNCPPAVWDRFDCELEVLRLAVEELEARGADKQEWRDVLV